MNAGIEKPLQGRFFISTSFVRGAEPPVSEQQDFPLPLNAFVAGGIVFLGPEEA